jgi:putative chitinase
MLLKVGSTGEDVTKLQVKLGVDPIGKFGPKTEAAVKGWQSAHGLTPDGIVGPNTWEKMFAPVTAPPTAHTVVNTPTSFTPIAIPPTGYTVVIDTPASFAPPAPSVSLPVFKLDALKGHVPQAIIDQIPDTAARFGITTPLRLAHFLSQTHHETGGFRLFSENLNYKAKGLCGIFRKYFPSVTIAMQYERKPEKIANRVYSSRMGNGNEASGDGWKYRGRGALQTTGKSNYQDFANFMKMPEIMSNPDLVATKYALASAGFFFKRNNLWTICDRGADKTTVMSVRKRVNGGLIGIDDVLKHFNEYYHLLA